MTPVATLRVRRPAGDVGTFIAERVERTDGAVDATGRWKRGSGRLSAIGTYTWPVARVLEVRWEGRR